MLASVIFDNHFCLVDKYYAKDYINPNPQGDSGIEELKANNGAPVPGL